VIPLHDGVVPKKLEHLMQKIGYDFRKENVPQVDVNATSEKNPNQCKNCLSHKSTCTHDINSAKKKHGRSGIHADD
jgi:hypothetical protein